MTGQLLCNYILLIIVIIPLLWNFFNITNKEIDLSIFTEKHIIVSILFYISVFILVIQLIQFIVEHWSSLI
jgi:hypothetical protein